MLVEQQIQLRGDLGCHPGSEVISVLAHQRAVEHGVTGGEAGAYDAIEVECVHGPGAHAGVRCVGLLKWRRRDICLEGALVGVGVRLDAGVAARPLRGDGQWLDDDRPWDLPDLGERCRGRGGDELGLVPVVAPVG